LEFTNLKLAKNWNGIESELWKSPIYEDRKIEEVKEKSIVENPYIQQKIAEKEAELQANVATIAEQNAQIVNIMKDVKDLKAGITSRFDGDSKKDNKKDDVITNQALSALENLKNKRKR
jgi:hypothetical protein